MMSVCATACRTSSQVLIAVEKASFFRQLGFWHPKFIDANSLGTASQYFSVIVDTKVKASAAASAATPAPFLPERAGGGPDGAGASLDADKPKEKDLRMDLGDIFYHVTYFSRSFVVQNQSSMPLEFIVSHNLQSGPSATEVNFSLSNATADCREGVGHTTSSTD